MKSIAVFNNKGGVGKTTLLCNLASYLKIKKDKRVLVIDADPQCNATIYVTPSGKLEEFYSNSKTETIFNIIKPLQRGNDYLSMDELPILAGDAFRFDIVLGDPKMAILEDFLSKDWIDGKNGEPRGLKTTFVLIDFLRKVKDRYDFVFFDVGPSLGAINRCVLLACDFFLMPMSSDIFSLKAVDNISESLKEWKRLINKGLETYTENSGGEKYIVDGEDVTINLAFLGYIYQQYTAKTKNGEKRPVNAYENIIKRMNSTVSKKLAGFFEGKLNEIQLKLGEIPTLNSLIPLSQTAHKPIFELTGRDGVVGAHFSKVREYEQVISHLEENIQNNLNAYELA